ncbi:transpeptidase [Salmonella enterica subsp. enterica serovar Choleraesuis]|nr:transpeptidase [Salmonella enterica subsp. enterica serovar Choleraesuis]
MRKIALIFAMLLMPCLAFANLLSGNGSDSSMTNLTPFSSNEQPAQNPFSSNQPKLMGSPVYIQIFKEERILELWVKMGEKYQLLSSYGICNYSGGLGPKRRQGDFKSPEGFYTVQRGQLKPDSRFYKAINIGFPNEYDRQHGYDGRFLMIHGACVSVGCYAMTDSGIDQIFQYVTGALVFGQPGVQVSIFPFRMTDANMRRHQYSYYSDFWKQLKPGYDYFTQNHIPPQISVVNGNYVVSSAPAQSQNQQPQLASNYNSLPE